MLEVMQIRLDEDILKKVQVMVSANIRYRRSIINKVIEQGLTLWLDEVGNDTEKAKSMVEELRQFKEKRKITGGENSN